ncbi:hypothetical protein DFH09DRAFT_338319 [Mycena vulgaris]|nr:hypothetical protein DFH09DRAFT_338319 [Mycena vulgaris]
MRRCTQCETTWYCSTECQRKDWARHKPWCKERAEELERECVQGGNPLADPFGAWVAAMGPALMTLICVQALAVYRHPEHIRSKFLLIALHEVTGKNPLEALGYDKTYMFDRAQFTQIVGVSPDSIFQTIRDDAHERSKGGAGTALVICAVKPRDTAKPSLVRVLPVRLAKEELSTVEEV